VEFLEGQLIDKGDWGVSGGRKRRNGEQCLMGMEFLFGKVKDVEGIDGGGDGTAL
jgi:hypothetical protein